MSDFIIGEQIEKHQDTLEGMGTALIRGDGQAFVAETVSLITTLATGESLLGSFAKSGLERIFGQSANAVLKQQIAEWNQELEQQQLIQRLAEVVEVLLAQALIQTIRSQHNVKGEIVEALGGLRTEFDAFRKEFGKRAAEAGIELRIEQQLVTGGATGVRVRASSYESALPYLRSYMVTPHATLSDLLRSIFSPAELRDFLRRLPRGKDLADALPEGLGITLLAGEAVMVLERRGRIDEALFSALVQHASDRYDEIAAVAHARNIPLPPRPPG